MVPTAAAQAAVELARRPSAVLVELVALVALLELPGSGAQSAPSPRCRYPSPFALSGKDHKPLPSPTADAASRTATADAATLRRLALSDPHKRLAATAAEAAVSPAAEPAVSEAAA